MSSRRQPHVAGYRVRPRIDKPAEDKPPEGGAATSHSLWATRATVIAAAASLLAALGGLYFSFQSNRQVLDTQWHERFTQYAALLDSDTDNERVAGVHAYALLMRDSTDDAAFNSIADQLSTFIVVRASSAAHPKSRSEPPADIVAALNVLGRHRPSLSSGWAGARLDGVDLSYWYLRNLSLSGAALSRAELSGADLSEADLSRAQLDSANLADAELSAATLSGADLLTAVLARADLVGADLTKAQLESAVLTDADLTDANLTGAKLFNTVPYGANLSGADLTGADLTDAICNGSTTGIPVGACGAG